jgi:hypothetical protein
MESFEDNSWARLRKEILKFYDAERAAQKYKPSDVVSYTLKTKNRSCFNLTQWKKYYIKYNTVAGGPYRRGHLSLENYLGYFWLGIHSTLRQILENRILQQRAPNDNTQYTMKEINRAAEWYFRRNKFESLIVNAAEYGVNVEDEYSGESESESSTESESDSDYEEFRKKKKLREKRKQKEKKQKLAAKEAEERSKLKYSGSEDEVASMIRKLNAMNINDPEYAPVYYKVMVMDKSGTASKCVQAPAIGRTEDRSLRPTGRVIPTGNSSANSGVGTDTGSQQSPATYPNNIPLGDKSGMRGTDSQNQGCFGCAGIGHRIFECKSVNDLIQKNVITFNQETRRLEMKNGTLIRRNPGETLVQAAERISAQSTPRVMLTYLDCQTPIMRAVQGFYQGEAPQSQIEEVQKEFSEDEREATEDETDHEIYLTIPRDKKGRIPWVQAADRTIPSTRSARKEAFDGVYPPSRKQVVKDLQAGQKRETSEPKKVSLPPKSNTKDTESEARSIGSGGSRNVRAVIG